MTMSLLSHRRPWSALGAVALLWGVLAVTAVAPAGAASTTLTPASLTTTLGSTGGSPSTSPAPRLTRPSG